MLEMPCVTDLNTCLFTQVYIVVYCLITKAVEAVYNIKLHVTIMQLICISVP